jgi:hypothetical protein
VLQLLGVSPITVRPCRLVRSHFFSLVCLLFLELFCVVTGQLQPMVIMMNMMNNDCYVEYDEYDKMMNMMNNDCYVE